MQSTGGQKRRIQWKQTFQSNKREKKKEKNWLCSGMWDRAHLLLPSGENEDGGESHPADEGQKTHAAQTHDTNKSSSSSRFSLPAYKNHQRENRSRQKNISTSFDVCVPLSLSPAQSLFLFLFLARARARERERSGKTSILATSDSSGSRAADTSDGLGWLFFPNNSGFEPATLSAKEPKGYGFNYLFIYLFFSQLANLSVIFVAKFRNLAIFFSRKMKKIKLNDWGIWGILFFNLRDFFSPFFEIKKKKSHI